jgi:hypothetical protein
MIMQFRWKVFVVFSIIISLLTVANVGYASTNTNSTPQYEFVQDEAKVNEVLRAISKNSGIKDVTELNHGQMNKHYKSMAYVPEENIYGVYFEKFNEKEMVGWSLVVYYDPSSDTVTDVTRIEVTTDHVNVKNKSRNMNTTMSKEQLEREIAKRGDCSCSAGVSTETKTSAAEDFFAPKASAAASEALKCAWATLLICTFVGFVSGGIGGFVCGAAAVLLCEYAT